MKNNNSKFIRHLSDDIVSENHNLKGEIIKVRKVLRNYQQKMVQQFVKLAKELGEDKNQGFFLEQPEEYLDYFIQVLNRKVMRAYELEQENRAYQIQNKNLKSKNELQDRLIDQLEVKERNNTAKIQNLENQNEDLSQKYKKIETSSGQEIKKLKLQVFKLKQEIKNMQNFYNIKFLEEKKAIMEKANKDIAKFRVEMDMQLHQKEKSMKLESDKRDKQIKNLLNTINSLSDRKEGNLDKLKQKPIQKTNMLSSMRVPDFNRNHSEIQHQATTPPANSFSFLSEFIKPFTEHTKLLDKLSEARKQNLQLKNQCRQHVTNLSVLQSSLSQKKNEVALFNEKFAYMKAKNDEMYQQFTKAKEQLEKSNQDKESMEKYYNQRWNTEINKVKYHLQKKFMERQSNLEEQYKVLSSVIEEQRQNLRIKEEILQKQCDKLGKLNKNLRQQLSLVIEQKKKVEIQLKGSMQKLKEIEAMHNEDMRSAKINFIEISNNWLTKMAEDQVKIKSLNVQIVKINEKHVSDIVSLKKQLQFSYEQKQKQSQDKQMRVIQEKNKDIEKLHKQLENQQAYIVSFQREQSQKMEEMRRKAAKQKQRQIREIKVFHFEELTKINEKTLKLEQKLKVTTNESMQKNFELTNELTEQQVKLTKQQVLISELEIVIKSAESQNKILQKQISHLQNVITTHLTAITSLNTQINSTELRLREKQEEISALVHEKQYWIKDIENCRKQFENGFKEIKQLNQKKVSYYRSRIWELERVCEVGGISKKDYELIKSLMEEKKKLLDQLAMKEAQNLILVQVKQYFENKAKQLDSKMLTTYELKDEKKPLFLRKPKRNTNQLKILRTQVSEDLDGFTGREAVEIKRFLDTARNKDRSEGKLQTAAQSQYQKNSRVMSRTKVRVNSSLM